MTEAEQTWHHERMYRQNSPCKGATKMRDLEKPLIYSPPGYAQGEIDLADSLLVPDSPAGGKGSEQREAD